jgi:hypothetical protein
VQKSSLAPRAKAAVIFQITLLQGRFDDCRKLLQQPDLQGDAETMAQLDKALRATEGKAQTVRKQLAHIRRTNYFGSMKWSNSDSPTTNLSAHFPGEEFPELSGCVEKNRYRTPCVLRAQLQGYFSAVKTHAELSPLNADAQDELFIYSLLTRPYEETAALGKQILTGKGTLTLPFDHKTGWGNLIIDQQRGLISAEQGEVIPQYNDRLAWTDFKPFSMSYGAIKILKQKIRVDGTVMPGYELAGFDRSKFLMFSDDNVVGPVAMSRQAAYLYGETVARQIMHNWGLFVKETINSPNLTASLLGTEATGGGGGGLLAALAMGAVVGANPSLAPMATQVMQNQAAAEQMSRESDPLGSAAWKQMAIEQPFLAFWKGLEDKLDSVGETIFK